MMEEIWKDIEGYEGLYQVSNLGRVKSLNYGKTGQERLLKQSYKKGTKYKTIGLYYGKQKRFFVHVLVAKAFVDGYRKGYEVNHIDENVENNRAENLEWVTHADNINHGTRNKRVSKKQLNNSERSRPVIGISVKDGSVIAFESLHEAERNGFNRGCVSQCAKNKEGFKTHKGYAWKYI